MVGAKAVLITGMPDAVNRQIAGYAPEGFVTTILSHQDPDDETVDALRDADFLLIHPGEISERVVRSATKLKLIQLLRAGHELMDVGLLRELGIPFANPGDAFAAIVADHTVMLLLALYRNLVISNAVTKAGRWAEPTYGLNAFEMEDKLVGILGLGTIGRQVAKCLGGFGCKVQYFSRHALPEEQELALNVRRVSLHELFTSSDIVTVHVPLTSETEGMVGKSELALMKPSAILINTSRGQVIDEPALIEALQKKRIAGAGLDVFEPQPPDPSNPLLKMDNVVATPHSASAAVEKWPRTAQFAWRNVQRVWEGQPPQALITE